MVGGGRAGREARGEVSRLLREHAAGSEEAFDALVPMVYDRLRALARRQIAGHQRGATLDTTALVHEAYLQLEKEQGVDYQDRGHFYAICARTMRRIIIDYARKRSAQKRGGGKRPATLEPGHAVVEEEAETWLAVDRALETMSGFNERLTRIVECRFFAGMTEAETAEALDISLRTVQRDWMRARAWLRKERARRRGVGV